MENQSNSDLNPTNPDTTSTFWDGRLLTQAIRDRELVYHDDTGHLWLFVYKDRLFAETELAESKPLSRYKHWRKIQEELEILLEDRGITKYWALADSASKARWLNFLGFEYAGETLHITQPNDEVVDIDVNYKEL